MKPLGVFPPKIKFTVFCHCVCVGGGCCGYVCWDEGVASHQALSDCWHLIGYHVKSCDSSVFVCKEISAHPMVGYKSSRKPEVIFFLSFKFSKLVSVSKIIFKPSNFMIHWPKANRSFDSLTSLRAKILSKQASKQVLTLQLFFSIGYT